MKNELTQHAIAHNTKHQELQKHVTSLLEGIGEDPSREGLSDTPKRYVNFITEFCNPPEFNFTTFDSEGMDEMIVQSNIPFFSLCEHHMLPFFGNAAIGYIPNHKAKKMAGLSKLARSVDFFCHRLQNQERITTQVAKFLKKKLETKDVVVILKARHLCMEMRGAKMHDTWTTTSKLFGVFKDDKPRNEFLNLIK